MKSIIIIHFNGCGYYYTTEKGQQVSKMYKTIGGLKRYGKINWDIIIKTR